MIKHHFILLVTAGFVWFLGWGIFPGSTSFCSSAHAARDSWSQQHYRRMTRSIFQRYQSALRERYQQPCVSHTALQHYHTWLKQLQDKLPNLALRTYHRKYLRARIRRYLRYATHQSRYTQRRCQKYWDYELKRRNIRINQRCQGMYGTTLQEEAAVLWLGVTPWAYVYLNNQLCGIAPLYARLKPGSYALRLTYPPGHDVYETTLQLTANKQPTLITKQMQSLPSASKTFQNLLAPEQLKWILQKHQSSLHSCAIYAPNISSIFLSWQIDGHGKSSDIRWERPTSAPERFQQCIVRTLQRIPFPTGKGIARIHSYEIKILSQESTQETP